MTLLILAAVSGTGKSTVARVLIDRHESLKLSVSHTTRTRRSMEVDGTHYHFVTRDAFQSLLAQDGFAEWAEYVGNYYGTARATIEQAAERNEDLLFDIELQGVRQMKAAYPECITCFLLPPSWEEVERRLTARGTDDAQTIARRLERGRIEMASARDFDFLVLNDDLERAVDEVEQIYLGRKGESTQARSHLEQLLESVLCS